MKKTKPSPKDIFFQVVQLDSREDQDAFLQNTCGTDQSLRMQVEELLGAHQGAGRFLGDYDSSIQTSTDDTDSELSGTQVGPYKLLEVIGEGGMGTVYMASQTEPIRRRVAVKVIKTGMDTRQVIARFEAERQTLALMDHPNISKVLDAGTTDSGRPYFVMELVKGIPITRFCDKQQMGLQQRLELFQQVCHAVQHAHQKGIIHRDIKPSNVLVAMYDDRPVVKVIDFGVAKATGEQLTEKTMFTRFGQVVGTLEYMSPEQAQFNQLDIDTRSDIYSLGAILCELISGEPPFNRKRLKSQALDETLRMIREEEPTKPSTKLSSSAQLAQVASNRNTTAEKLGSQLRGDLDWIAMKALDKDRARRYETANGLALDLEHYLSDEPVTATPPSSSYRLRKFVRRNKISLAFASTIGIGLLAAIVGLSISNRMISHREIEKNKAIQTAEDNFHRAQSAVDNYLTLVSEETLLQAPSMQPLRKQLLELALSYYKEFASQQESNPDLQKELSDAYYRVGQITRMLGTAEDAIAAHQKAFQLRTQLVSNHPVNFDLRRDLALSSQELGRLFFQNHKFVEGEKYLELAVQGLEELAGDSPNNDDVNVLLARSLSYFGRCLGGSSHNLSKTDDRFAAAEAHFKRGIEVCKLLEERNSNQAEIKLVLAGLNNGLGSLLGEVGLIEESLKKLEEAIKFQSQYVDLNPLDLSARHNLALYYYSVGFVFNSNGNPEEGLRNTKLAVDIQSKLVNENPAVHMYKTNLRNFYYRLARISTAMNRNNDALDFLQQSIKVGEELIKLDPIADNRFFLAKILYRLGGVHNQTKDTRSEIKVLRSALELSRALKTDFPNDTKYQEMFVACAIDLAPILSDQDQADSERILLEAMPITEQLMVSAPGAITVQNYFTARSNLSDLLQKQHRNQEAEELLDKTALKLTDVIGPFNTLTFRTIEAHANLLTNQERYDESLKLLMPLSEDLKLHVDNNPDDLQAAENYLVVKNRVATCLLALERFEELLDMFRVRLEEAERLISRWPDSVFFQAGLAGARSDLGGELIRRMIEDKNLNSHHAREASMLIDQALQTFTALCDEVKLDDGNRNKFEQPRQVTLYHKSYMFALEGDYAQAVEPLERLVKEEAVEEGLWLGFAEAFLFCSTQLDGNSEVRDEEAIRHYQDLSIHCLEKSLVDAEVWRLKKLLDEPDLMTLQDHPEIQSFLERLRTRVKSKTNLSNKEQ